MKYCSIIIFVFISIMSSSQEFRGVWNGEFKNLDSTIHVKMNVMVQNVDMIGAILLEPTFCSLSDSNFNGINLHLKTTKLHIAKRNENLKKRALIKNENKVIYNEVKFEGALAYNKNQLNGELTLDDKVFPVTLFRDSIPIYRPQEPKRPFPYYWENVVCRNLKDSTVLAGTLTLPQKEGKFPVVILKSGSSPTNRDGDSNHHKFFLVLADQLTRNGIAVLRYDDRGVGRSTGNFYESTPLDLSGDILAWKNFLVSREEIISSKIGIIGHSEGGMVAAMAASLSNDFDFIVMLGTAGLKMRDVFEEQTKLRLESGEMSREQYESQKKRTQKIYELMELHQDSKIIADSLMKYKEEFISVYIDSLTKGQDKQQTLKNLYLNIITTRSSPHNLFNLNLNPTDYLEKVTCPVLSLGGSLDRLVPSKENQAAIKQALVNAGNKIFQIMELEGLNHFFQECEKGTITEAMKIEQTFSPKALEIITNWILFQTKNE